MSWLERLNQVYENSPYRLNERDLTLPESPNCEVNLRSLDEDALVLDFEKLVDDRARSLGNALPKKCDLVALFRSDSNCHVLMIEVKGSGSVKPRSMRRAAEQIKNTKRIIERAMKTCDVEFPKATDWDALIVVNNPSQSHIARNETSRIVADFRRDTGIGLRIEECGVDVVR